MLLGFAKKNPGMTRVLIGDALVNENERLQLRINQLHDRLEATLKQCLRFRSARRKSGAHRRGGTCESAALLRDGPVAAIREKAASNAIRWSSGPSSGSSWHRASSI
jgi:hypothetical protein